MTTTFHNSSLRSNINRDPPQVIPSDIQGDIIEIRFPTKYVKSVDLVNKPASTIDGYTANKKTMVQNIFNDKNLNEKLNFKNTYYLTERGDQANKEANTIYGYDKIYPNEVVDADLKAEYAAKVWKDMHIKSEKKVKDALRETTENIARFRDDQAKTRDADQAKHEKEVKKYFKKVQNLVGVMVGTIPASSKGPQEKFSRPAVEDEGEQIGVHNIDKDANDEETVLNNRANIRTLLGTRSVENQERIQAEKEAKEKVIALEEAQRAKIERQEEMRISKYLDLQKLSKTWRIPDQDKLKGVVRNEIMKDIMKEEERKNFVQIAQNMKKKIDAESPKKSLIKKSTKPKIEPPKAFSPSKKKKQQGKDSKKYAFSPEKIQKLPAESQADYKARFNFTVMALPEQKETLDPVEQHNITKKFQEMIVKNGVEKNGKIMLNDKK